MSTLMDLKPLPPTYTKEKFILALQKIRSELLGPKQPNDFKIKLKEICEKADVVIIYTKNFKNAPINGAARWINNIPLIQLSGRYNKNDIFWFTFFHEAGHIILHAKKPVSINFRKSEEEKEVDTFATKWLANKGIFKELIKNGIPTKEQIIQISEEYNLHKGIIVGHLQHKGLLNWGAKLNEFKESLNLFD